MFHNSPHHPLFSRSPQNAMIWKMHPTEKINTRSERLNEKLVRMQFEFQMIIKKRTNLGNEPFQPIPIFRKNHKIVGVANVVPYFQLVLRELIELVHIDIRAKLGCEIAE